MGLFFKNESICNSGFGSGSSSSSSSNSSSDSVSSSSSSSSSGSGSDSSYNYSSNSNPNPNSNSVPNLSPNPNPNPNPNYNSEVLISEIATQIREAVPQIREAITPMVKHGRSPIHEVVTPIRNFNKCNYIKPLTDFDESKYTCRSCTSAIVNCPYCASIVRYDGI